MKALVEKISAEIADFKANAEAQVEKGNKAAGARARKAALDLMKLARENPRFQSWDESAERFAISKYIRYLCS